MTSWRLAALSPAPPQCGRRGRPGPARREMPPGACAAGGVRAEPPPGRPALAARQPPGTFPKTGPRHGRGTPAPHHTSRKPQAPHIFAATRAEPQPPSRDWGLWHLTPVRWGRGPGPPEESSGLRFASRFWRKSGDWAERVGDHALAQPRAAPGALTCSGIESRRGAAWAVHPASVDVTRSAAAAQALAELLRLLWPSRPRGCRASFVKRYA